MNPQGHMPETQAKVTVTQGGRSLARYLIEQPGAYVIGRDPGCQLPVEVAGIADRHARLTFDGKELRLEDLNTEVGTMLDGNRVAGSVLLGPRQTVQLGSATLEIELVQKNEQASEGPADAAVTRQGNDPALLTPGGTPAQIPAADRSRSSAQPIKYEVGDVLARGGMGAVLSARDLGIGRTVAMKEILAERQSSPEVIRRFVQEAKLTGQLEHPGIVPVYELGTDAAGRTFYTMKLVQGVTLQEVLKKIKAGDADVIAKYPLTHLLTVFQKVCDAVAFAHSRDVIHRDLKPENIMIGEYGEVLVMDWGLAKVINSANVEHPTSNVEHRTEPQSSVLSPQSSDLTLAGQIMGTPQFMAPEQAEGKVDEIDARTDIFSLGAILYNILTLRPPVSAGSVQEMFQKIRTGEIVRPTSYNLKEAKAQRRAEGQPKQPIAMLALRHCPDGKIPESLSAVTMKALALKAEDRYQTVKDLQKDIEAFQGGFATLAEGAGAFKLIRLLIKRHKTLFLVSHAALLIVVIVSVAFSIRNAATLRRLRATAPEFYAQTVALVGQQKFDDALQKISYAVELTPERAEYHYLQGNILETLLRIEPARAAYEQALRCDKAHAKARENLELCKKMLQNSAGQQQIPPPALHELYLAMRRQERFVEAQVIMQKLGSRLGLETAMTVLKEAGISGKLQVDPEGLLTLDLSNTSIKDISPLRGLPLKELALANTQVSDLSPLRGMPLRKLYLTSKNLSDLSPLEGMALEALNLTGTQVRDLSPLRGMALQYLVAGSTRVSDISPLKGMPLDSLDLSNTQVTDISVLKGMPLIELKLSYTRISDISVLRGMPLKFLMLEKCENLLDLTPLADCQQLEFLLIPTQCKNIEFLRTMPNLKRLAYALPVGGSPAVPTVAEFWKEYDAKKAAGQKAGDGR